ncbi:MAG: hypothetical protein JW888_14250 [Pirellulales bacterium]|nr:hypothetical protein [Pirellulales bacterium]
MRSTRTLRTGPWRVGTRPWRGALVLALLVLVATTSALAGVEDDPLLDEPASPTTTRALPATPTDQPVSTLQVVPKEENPVAAQAQTTEAPSAAERDANSAVGQETPVSTQAATKPSERSLEPIPEAENSGPPKVETAGFNGITPGRSTLAQVTSKWGPPKEVRKDEGTLIHRYVLEPFDQVEVNFSGETVASIVVRLQQTFPAKAVAEQLQLAAIRPVLVSNELGDILGQVYPERGVLFAFQQNHEPGKPSMKVTEIVLEPVSADSFVLRAETNLQSNFKQNVHDLDEAIKLAPNNARAHWLRARVLTAMGRLDEGVAASRRAIALDAENARFRVTHAQILDQAGHRKEAIAETATAITMSDERPHVKARAQCLMGDLLGEGADPDWETALKFHIAAIKTADPLAVNRHPAIRLAAKEVMIDAHLGAANDIAWGRWGGKEKAFAEWTRRASAFAEELIANDGGTNEHRFRVANRTLASLVGVQGGIDPTDWVKEAVQVGNEMIDATADVDEQRELRWELGMALFNAVQIYQSRKEHDFALECGQEAIGYIEPRAQDGPLAPEQRYLLGRLCFRLGTIHALVKQDHKTAIVWFDKAIPLTAQSMSDQPDAEWGRHGETLVSMGVSYWETDQQDKALQLTLQGLTILKRVVSGGAMPKSVLAVPYENLAAMQRHLGRDKEATEMQKLADDAKTTKAARQNSTAEKPVETLRR